MAGYLVQRDMVHGPGTVLTSVSRDVPWRPRAVKLKGEEIRLITEYNNVGWERRTLKRPWTPARTISVRMTLAR